MEMNKENNTPFKVEDVNWEELASVKEAVARMKAEGIYTEELWK